MDDGAAVHPSGALGVGTLVLVARRGEVEKWAGAYGAITGVEPLQDEHLKERGAIALRIPQPKVGSRPTTLIIQPPQDAFQETLVDKQEVSIAEIVSHCGRGSDLPQDIDENVIDNGGFRIRFSIDA